MSTRPLSLDSQQLVSWILPNNYYYSPKGPNQRDTVPRRHFLQNAAHPETAQKNSLEGPSVHQDSWNGPQFSPFREPSTDQDLLWAMG